MKKTTKSTKTTKNTKTTEKKPKVVHYFTGKVPATKVFVRDLTGFSKKQGNQCEAKCFLILNDNEDTVTFANTYDKTETPKSSYDPATYTFTLKPKLHERKMIGMRELEVTSWPAWIENAGRRSRKAK